MCRDKKRNIKNQAVSDSRAITTREIPVPSPNIDTSDKQCLPTVWTKTTTRGSVTVTFSKKKQQPHSSWTIWKYLKSRYFLKESKKYDPGTKTERPAFLRWNCRSLRSYKSFLENVLELRGLTCLCLIPTGLTPREDFQTLLCFLCGTKMELAAVFLTYTATAAVAKLPLGNCWKARLSDHITRFNCTQHQPAWDNRTTRVHAKGTLTSQWWFVNQSITSAWMTLQNGAQL